MVQKEKKYITWEGLNQHAKNVGKKIKEYDAGVIGGYNGSFPLTAATKGNIYLLPATKKYYVCIENYNGSQLTAPNANFEELSVYTNRSKLDNLFEGDFHFRKFFHADGRNSMQISLADIIGGERAFNGTIELTIGSHRMDYHALKVIKYTFNYSQGYGVVYDSNLSSDISISIDLSNSYPIFTIHAPREDSLLSVFMDIYRSNGAGHL